VSCGQSHSILLTGKGTCYTWGHVADGRLGVGTARRLGVKDPENRYFPTPTIVASIKTEVVVQVRCIQGRELLRRDGSPSCSVHKTGGVRV
jgi:alpha-tubulin suppressor-like RCC1 family protein